MVDGRQLPIYRKKDIVTHNCGERDVKCAESDG
jgi:hypothetical protein